MILVIQITSVIFLAVCLAWYILQKKKTNTKRMAILKSMMYCAILFVFYSLVVLGYGMNWYAHLVFFTLFIFGAVSIYLQATRFN